MTLSDLAKHLRTRSIARPVCNHWRTLLERSSVVWPVLIHLPATQNKCEADVSERRLSTPSQLID